jgi:hypothetical protein
MDGTHHTARATDLTTTYLGIAFHHIAAVPREAVNVAAAGALMSIGLVAAAIGLAIFAGRDLRTG